MPAIFICYRRDDSGGYAGRLHADLVERFGEHDVFMDVRGIDPGKKFDPVIANALGSCKVLLVIIGKQWLNMPDSRNGGRRLDNPDDYVRREILEGLRRGITVIPVRVGKAPLPTRDELPEALKPLADFEDWELFDRLWAPCVEKLVETLEQETGITAKTQASIKPSAQTLVSPPHLVPIGATFGGGDGSGRLAPGTQHTITFQNQGGSIPTDVHAVLFPSRTYIKMNTMPQQRYTLEGTYWDGQLDVTPMPGERATIVLREGRFPLYGDLCIYGNEPLFAPKEPNFGAYAASVVKFRSARLTVTFQDNAGKVLAAAFDYRPVGSNWTPVFGPVEVARDLSALEDEAAEARRPPVYSELVTFDLKKASEHTKLHVGSFIAVLKNPHMGVDIRGAEALLRRELEKEGRTPEYIESAVRYAYNA